MRILQIIVAKLLSLGVLTLGVAAVAAWFERDYLHMAKALFLSEVWIPWGAVFGAAAAVAGLLALLPLKRPRRNNTITFPGSHGNVTLQLDSVEATLSRVVGKLPEVKKINVRVTPSEDNRRAQVTADVWMYKTSGPAGARELANRISDYLADTAVNILGVEDVTNVNLNVRGVIVDPSKTTPETVPHFAPAVTAVAAPVAAVAAAEAAEATEAPTPSGEVEAEPGANAGAVEPAAEEAAPAYHESQCACGCGGCASDEEEFEVTGETAAPAAEPEVNISFDGVAEPEDNDAPQSDEQEPRAV